jgi:hypothetical protein
VVSQIAKCGDSLSSETKIRRPLLEFPPEELAVSPDHTSTHPIRNLTLAMGTISADNLAERNDPFSSDTDCSQNGIMLLWMGESNRA